MTDACLAIGLLLLTATACGAAVEPTDVPSERGPRTERLRASVEMLATTIGERHTRKPEALKQAGAWVSAQLAQTGLEVRREAYEADGQTVANVYVNLPGKTQPGQWIIIGAHYDSVRGCPAANDNGSGVAALVELAQSLAKAPRDKSIRFVAFVNEEPPFFQTELMGSLVHADGCKERREDVVAMISLETIGYFSDAPRSQQTPPFLEGRYPEVGNFIAIVSDPRSAPLAEQVNAAFGKVGAIPAVKVVLPATVPGVGWSDHWSFWHHRYPAIMIADTAPFRYPHYHQPIDTPDKIDYSRMALVVDGVEKAVEALASEREKP